MADIRDTKVVREALALAELVLAADNPIGEISGPAGSVSQVAGLALVHRLAALLIAALEGMSTHELLVAVAQMLGIEGTGAEDRLLRLVDAQDREMLVVDEANKCSWRVLES
ncbi:MAG: ATP-binding protein, partial [Tepidimonas taiwanensis]|nr:ATP-binding protein [Tepidimonas taiwanensis]